MSRHFFPAHRFVKAAFPVLLVLAAASCGGDSPRDGTVTAPDTIRVLAYNIHHGEGMDDLLDLERIAALIRQ